MTEDLIDIDSAPDVIVELSALVEEQDGTPYLAPTNPTRWLSFLTPSVGQVVRLMLLRPKKRRTDPQNRYLWGGVYQDILHGMREKAQEADLPEPPFRSKEDVHQWGKWKFLRTVRVFPGGEEEEVPGSTRKLSTKEFADYVEALSAWAAQRGVYVRKPNEVRSLRAA